MGGLTKTGNQSGAGLGEKLWGLVWDSGVRGLEDRWRMGFSMLKGPGARAWGEARNGTEVVCLLWGQRRQPGDV